MATRFAEAQYRAEHGAPQPALTAAEFIYAVDFQAARRDAARLTPQARRERREYHREEARFDRRRLCPDREYQTAHLAMARAMGR